MRIILTSPSLGHVDTVELAGHRVAQLWLGGADTGPVVLFFHGCPDTRWAARSGEDAAREAGVRLLCVNRPGYGASRPGTLVARVGRRRRRGGPRPAGHRRGGRAGHVGRGRVRRRLRRPAPRPRRALGVVNTLPMPATAAHRSQSVEEAMEAARPGVRGVGRVDGRGRPRRRRRRGPVDGLAAAAGRRSWSAARPAAEVAAAAREALADHQRLPARRRAGLPALGRRRRRPSGARRRSGTAAPTSARSPAPTGSRRASRTPGSWSGRASRTGPRWRRTGPRCSPPSPAPPDAEQAETLPNPSPSRQKHSPARRRAGSNYCPLGDSWGVLLPARQFLGSTSACSADCLGSTTACSADAWGVLLPARRVGGRRTAPDLAVRGRSGGSGGRVTHRVSTRPCATSQAQSRGCST